MSLSTNLSHIESDAEFAKVLAENENVMITCGRMGPMCLPVYDAMEALEGKYPHVAFRDMAFDGPAAHNIKSLPQVRHFTGLPFVIYFKNGQVVEAVSGIQSKQAVRAVLDAHFAQPLATASCTARSVSRSVTAATRPSGSSTPVCWLGPQAWRGSRRRRSSTDVRPSSSIRRACSRSRAV